jgi:gamma-glutamyltranspeptidase/glutathione hydrolase
MEPSVIRLAIRFCVTSFLVIVHPYLSAATRAPVANDKGLVTSISPIASEVGAQVLREGGTAADAAVAVAFALAVTWPSAGNIGGGGFALVHQPSRDPIFLDYRETAPAAAGPEFYLNDKGEAVDQLSREGYRAAGVPGTVAGMALLHKTYGKLPWRRLVNPARLLASKGFVVDSALEESLRRSRKLLEKFPGSRSIFFRKDRTFKRGETLVQKDLGATLKLIEDKGPDAFYKGAFARKMANEFKANGGVLVEKDLADYRVIERKPLQKAWRGFEIVTAPPPSSGGAVLLAILGMLENDPIETMGPGSADYTHLLIEAMKKAFADRSVWFGDPAFVDNPIDKLLDPVYLAKRRAEISMTKAAHDVQPGELPGEKLETTHFSIRDKFGMAVSNTYTLNGSYGSGAVLKGTGILLNNEMDDFTSKVGTSNMFGLKQGSRNLIAPGKRPLSSMTPTLVFKGKDLVLVVGAPGGPTIINSVTQTIINRLIFKMNIQQAADFPRFHHQWQPDKIWAEPFGINPDTRKTLEARGHIFGDEPRQFGDIEALAWDEELGLWTGAADSRNGGAVAWE